MPKGDFDISYYINKEMFKRHTDVVIAGLVIGIVLLIIIPLGANALDFLVTLSFALALVILLITMFTTEPLEFSIFPSLLLVVTLYRLALNISSTRLILGEASAGEVIQAFGTFVVGGSYIVGAVVFLIITLIQFVVITNGAGRVAEVAARFTLDAMPGKQMSIDADLNSGLISEDEARNRRERLQREADFYGAMDGASKFVKGDALAGLVIIFINIIGGFIIGMIKHGMSVSEALETYTILTIGDGLVTQIPALLVSTATGILVTRSTSDNSFGTDLSKQFLSFPKVNGLVAAMFIVMGFMPGMPMFLFFAIAGVFGYVAYLLDKNKKEERLKKQQEKDKSVQEEKRQPENVSTYFQVDILEIEIGYNLIVLTDESQGGDLLQRLSATRRQCAAELGIFVRPIRIRDNMQLGQNNYVIKIKGVKVAEGELLPTHYLVMDSTGTVETSQIKGIPTKEPAFGLPAWWIEAEERESAELMGLTVVDCSTVLITHLTEIIKRHAAELLGRQEVKELVDIVKQNSPAVVEELVPDLMTIGEIQKVLQNLLRERIPIKDMVTILEYLADGARINKDSDFLTEHVRQGLSRAICQMYMQQNNKISVVTLHPKLEQEIADSIQQMSWGRYPVLDPKKTNILLERLQSAIQKANSAGISPVLLTSPNIRLPFRRMLERYLPEVSVISINEIAPGIEVEAVGTVSID